MMIHTRTHTNTQRWCLERKGCDAQEAALREQKTKEAAQAWYVCVFVYVCVCVCV